MNYNIGNEAIDLTWEAFKAGVKIANPLVKAAFESDYEYIRKKEPNSPILERHMQILQRWVGERELPKDQVAKLIVHAQIGRTHAYAPYSNFQVGAALLTKKGEIFTGCNVENAAYGSTICAERTAICKAISEINYGNSHEMEKEIVALALILRTKGSPCGSCRQMLNEANPNMTIYMADVDGTYTITTLKDLLPLGFGPENLR